MKTLTLLWLLVATLTAQNGALIYKSKCMACHGKFANLKALGTGGQIAGWAKNKLVTILKEYRDGTRDASGMGLLMNGQIKRFSNREIEAVSDYLSNIKQL